MTDEDMKDAGTNLAMQIITEGIDAGMTPTEITMVAFYAFIVVMNEGAKPGHETSVFKWASDEIARIPLGVIKRFSDIAPVAGETVQ